MNGLFKNIIGTFSAQVPALIISIISGVFMTRILGPEGKGLYALYFANIELIVLFFLLGCDLAIVYFGANSKISMGKLQGISIYLLIFIIPVLIILSFVDTDMVFPSEADSVYYRLIFISMIFFSMINTLVGAFFKSQKMFKYINRISLTNSVLNLTIFLSLYTYSIYSESSSIGFREVFLISLIINLINVSSYIFYFLKNIKFLPDFKIKYKSDLKPFIIYLLPIFSGVLINFFNYRADIWIVDFFKDKIELGYYVLAVNFAQFILLYARIIGTVIMPYLSNSEPEERYRYFTSYSRFILVSILIMIGMFLLTGKYLVTGLYGMDFYSSISVFQILLVGMFFTSLNQIYSIYFFSIAKNKTTLLASVIGLVVTIVFDLILIPNHGITGAAIATNLSYFSIFVVLVLTLIFKEKIQLKELFLFRKGDIKLILKR